MARYDYACSTRGCGLRREFVLSIKSNPAAPLECPDCGQPSMHRVLDSRSLARVCCDTSNIAYQNRFPYVSNAFPFKGSGAKHVGPMGKCLIESKKHEEQMRVRHGYVGENKVESATSFENDRPAFASAVG